jgi:hypothetical protein
MKRLAWCALFTAACAHRARPPDNVVDLLFRSQDRAETAADAGTAVDAYRALVRPALGSQCRWLPSDSEYLVRSTGSCGAVRATYAAFAQLLEEPDLSAAEHPVITSGGLRWLRAGLRCDP